MDFNGSDYDACGNSPPTASRHLSTTPPLQTGSLHSTPVSATSTAPSPLLTPDNAKPIRSCDFKNTIPSSRALGHLLDPHGRLSGDDTPNCHNLASPKGFGGYLSEEAKAVYHEQQLIWTETSKAFEPPGGNSAQKVKTVSEINKRKRDEPEQLPANKKTGWGLIQHRWPQVSTHVYAGRNTEYVDTGINLENLQEWDDTFPTYQEIYDFSKSTYFLHERFHAAELGDLTGDSTFHNKFFDPVAPMVLCEADLAAIMNGFFDHLNFLIRLATHRTSTENYVIIHGSKAARLRRPGGKNCDRKEPDKTSFWYDGVNPRCSSNENFQRPPPWTNVPCLLVGDYKLTGKFNHRMLLERSEGNNEQLQNVMNQLHDYMDMHYCRFGYILNETELIMLRRREGEWGLVDFSHSIPRNAAENELNAMMVLWYFHVKYAAMNEEPGYQLDSYYEQCPEDLGGGVYSEKERNRLNEERRRQGLPQLAVGATIGKNPKKTANRKAVFKRKGQVTLP